MKPPFIHYLSEADLRGLRKKERFYQYPAFYGNVNRLIDTKGLNRILGKPLKTRDSGTLAVAGIPCLLLEPVWKCAAVGRGGVHFWTLPKEHLNPVVRENEHPMVVLNPVVKKVLVWSGWGGLYLLLLLYDLTSFDIIMIKISDVSYGITVSIGV